MNSSDLCIGFWNIRGLNDPLKQKEAKIFVRTSKLSMVGLLEHKIKESNVDRILKYICPHWHSTHNYRHAPLGRILVCWDPLVLSVTVLDQSNQFIHCEVHALQGDHIFLATFVYGSNSYIERHTLWQSIQSFKSITPWVVLGDFNAIRTPHEKAGGPKHWFPHMDDLNNCLHIAELDDLRYSGCYYTWSNKQVSPNHVSTKIDRIIVNESWIKSHTCSSARFPTPGISDHSPGLVFLTPPPKKTIKPFRFFDFLAEHPLFLPIVQKVWRMVIIGNPMFCLNQKLNLLQKEFKDLNTKEFSAISDRVRGIKQQLDTLQFDLGTNPNNPVTQVKEKEVSKQYFTLVRAEESLARQKSRIQWLKLGDQCTSFFFKSVSNNRNRSKITSLELGDGSITQDIGLIKSTFVEYYSKLLGTPHISHYNGSIRVDELVRKKLTAEQSLNMVQEVTESEIKDTLWSLNPSKAPGPDGYNAGFFHKAWPVVGHEVIGAVKSFFRSGQLLRAANSTTIALVPKIPNPSKVGDFRPISCCNTVYKCVAKILANRLQAMLPDLIDPIQSGFVKGRRIADNIFLTQELMRGYHKSNSPSPKCAMKVDIMKAYDNVRWEFLWNVLTSMNFHSKMIQWLQACVTTANYSISINGEATGYINGKKGLRQGDPLSSYLFVIVMEILTCILKEKATFPDFHFHWKCDQPKLVNLCFADDLMIFCKGELRSIQHIQAALSEFESLSGLSPSPGKSSIFFSGIHINLFFFG